MTDKFLVTFIVSEIKINEISSGLKDKGLLKSWPHHKANTRKMDTYDKDDLYEYERDCERDLESILMSEFESHLLSRAKESGNQKC